MDLKTLTAVTFTEPQQGSVILDKLCRQRRHGVFCDVVLHVDNLQLPAHRSVLAACSPYFDAMLKKDKSAMEHINVDCKNPCIFQVLIDYVYTGTIIVDSTNIDELIRLSNRLMISKLKDHCCEYLEQKLTVSNCFTTNALAQKCGLLSLCKVIDAFILANIIDIVQQDEILLFSNKKIQEFVSDKTLPVREELKLHVINRWTSHAVDERQGYFQHLLGLLAWNKINTSVILTILNDDVLYKTSEWCLYGVLSALNDKGDLSPPFKLILKELQNKFSHIEPLTQFLQLPINSLSNATGKKEEGGMDDLTTDVQQNVVEQLSIRQVTSPEDLDDTGDQQSLVLETAIDWADGLDSEANSGTDVSEIAMQQCDQQYLLKDGASCEKNELIPVNDKKKRTCHKRKGIPVKINPSPIKVRISKARIKMETSIPKKRGRPPKHGHKIAPSKYKENIKEAASLSSQVEKIDNTNDNNDCTDSDTNKEVFLNEKNRGRKQKGKRRKSNLHTNTNIHCDDCKFMCTSLEKLEKHKARAHRTNNMYSCPLCDYQSSWNRDYYNHVKTHFPGPPFLCDYSCGYSGERIQHLLYHRMTHTDERPFVCTVCNMSFRSKNNLAMHVRCHTGVKPFKCEICNRSFATKGTLDQHSVTHSDLRPYLCDLCGFSTKYQSHLIAHKRIHSGDVFRCQYPNCKYSTPKKSQLACHMRTHMSIRSHICSVCGRAFVEKSHLVRHEKIHLEEKPFKCEYCDYGSTRRDKLKDHVTKYHADGSSPPKTPYKPRKTRRQTYDPSAFPLLSSEQASQEMASLLQQSDSLRQQQRQQNVTLPTSSDSHQIKSMETSLLAEGLSDSGPDTSSLLSSLMENSHGVDPPSHHAAIVVSHTPSPTIGPGTVSNTNLSPTVQLLTASTQQTDTCTDVAPDTAVNDTQTNADFSNIQTFINIF